MPVRRTDNQPVGSAMSIANAAPPSTATGKGMPVLIAIRPVTYAEAPQNAACPNDNSPVYPSSRSTEIANNPHARMSIATGG